MQYNSDSYRNFYHFARVATFFNHGDHKDFAQSTRRTLCALRGFFFVYFVIHLLMNKVLNVQVSDTTEAR